MNETRDLLERVGDRFAFPEHAFERLERRRDRKRRNQRVTAGIVGVAVFVLAIWFATGGPSDRTRSTLVPGGAGTGPGVTGPTEPTMAPEAGGIVGLPLEGAAPSTPERGRLVLYLEGNVSGRPTALWVYADGRLIWGDVFGNLPDGAPAEGATGFVEQQLTPSWVESLQDQVISTGLFEDDLALLRGPGDPPFLTIRARNGDRLVWLTWAVEENYRVPKDAPQATPEQANAIKAIYTLLTDQTSWPASAWEDQDPETFVPSRYQVWLRVGPDQGPGPDVTVGEREVALLPAPAADLLRHATKLDRAGYEMTTEDARAFAEALIEGGLEPLAMPMGAAVVRFSLEHPDHPGNSLFVFFGPVLPHGEAVFLGPG
ncbi:MAG TPA: hypothetical protein VE669_11755 [Actinomycetota bacterium]|jgi:hypothetical protein|nr:hypothetical protein [Actinomycetota bacterium]